MFYFDSNTFVPFKCHELTFWKADVDRMKFDRLFLLFSPLLKNTHLVFLTFFFHFLSKNMWISSNNTRVQIFYFDSNTTVPLQCVALVFWKAYVERMSFG